MSMEVGKATRCLGRCEVCGNPYDRCFQVVTGSPPYSTHVFDSFECAIQALAPRCAHCGCRVIGHGVDAGELFFCCDHCARESSSESVDEAERESFPASDPPASSPITAGRPVPVEYRRQEGRVGWILLWLIGIPLPVLLVLYGLRGCT